MTEVRSLDLTGTVAPALSTTSDMPTAGAPKEPAPTGAVSEEELAAGGTEQVKADDKAKADAEAKAVKEAADKAAEAAKKKEGDGEPKDDTPAWQKREITKARNRQREAEARATHLEERLDKALTALEKAATRTDSEIKTEAADPRPVRPARAAYDDPDQYDAAVAKYDDALVAWSAKTAAKVTQAEIEKQTKEREAGEAKAKTEREQQAEQKERLDAWVKATAKGAEKYPDYADVAENPDVPITPAMAFSILEENLESGEGFEINYYLGTHLEEAAKIAALPQSRQGIAIGRLAERLAAERAKPAKVTKAPDPVKPIGSKARATEKSADEESMEEYAARRKAEIRASPH